MPGENYPGKLWMQCVTTSADGSTFESDGVARITRPSGGGPPPTGFFIIELTEAVDPEKVRVVFDSADHFDNNTRAISVGHLWEWLDNKTIAMLQIGLAIIDSTPTDPRPENLQGQVDGWGVIPSCGAPYCANFAAGAPIDFSGPFLDSGRPSPRRGVQIESDAAGPDVVIQVQGITPSGKPVIEAIPFPGASLHVAGSYAYETIQKVTSNIDPGRTISVQWGPTFELSAFPGFQSADPAAPEVVVLGVDGVEEAPVSFFRDELSITPTTPPDGAKRYTVRIEAVPKGITGGPSDGRWSLNITRLHF